jgi:hypothetical protein
MCRKGSNAQIQRFLASQLSIADIKLNEATFDSVQKELGVVTSVSGKTDSAPTTMCYWTEQRSGILELEFESGAAGGWSTVTGYRLKAKATPSPSCGHISDGTKLAEPRAGLSIGMLRDDAIKVFGDCHCKRSGCGLKQEQPGSGGAPKFTELTGVEAAFANDRVVTIFVYQTLTD